MEDKQVVTAQFSRELVAKLDGEATKHFRSRSAEMEFLLTELFAQMEKQSTPKKSNGSSK